MPTALHILLVVVKAIFFALPGIVAFLFAAAALAVIYMDELQTELKDQRRIRWIVAVTLLLMVGAFIADAVQKIQERNERETAIERTAKEVAAETSKEVTKVVTGEYVQILADQKTQITQFQNRVGAQVASLKTQFETARKHGDNQLAAVYQTQMREILIREVAPTVIAQMQTAYDSWKADDTTSRHKYPLGKGDPQYFKDQESFERSYTASVKSTMVNANFVREQLLDTVTVEVREKTLDYPQIVPVFESGKTGQVFKLDELGRAIGYMNKLVRVISALPPQPQK
jgi:hypothetical protein